MKIKCVLTSENASSPKHARLGDAGADLYASSDITLYPFSYRAIPISIKLEIPNGCYGALVGRSSLAAKGVLCHYGTIDNGYRGEISALLFNTSDTSIEIKAGERIAQLIIQPFYTIDYEIADTLSDSERGEGGFGSTNK